MSKEGISRKERKEKSVQSRLDSMETRLKQLVKEHNQDRATMSSLGYQLLVENAALRNLIFGSRFLRWMLRITRKRFKREMKRVERQILMEQRLKEKMKDPIRKRTDVRIKQNPEEQGKEDGKP
jgi:hypothetical protein